MLREWRELSRFRSLEPTDRSIVFYAEDAASWAYFQPIVKELIGVFGKRICYITSSPDDQILRNDDDRIRTFYVGFGTARTVLFLTLQAGVMVLTMPDLETYHIKRSRKVAHYVYVFHSLISTHMSYRKGAFDHFDTVLCVGPHHEEEIRATESLYSLRPKTLVRHGYGRLDSILKGQTAQGKSERAADSAGRRVLIAPSWGKHSIVETCGREVVEVLLKAGHHVKLRPHPMTLRNRWKKLAALNDRFLSSGRFGLDLDMVSSKALDESDVIVCDWGGTALEYAFARERPVLFIDLPRKLFNSEYEKLPCVPIEVTLRPEIGAIVPPDRLSEVPRLVDELCEDPEAWSERLRRLRSQWVYNVGASGAAGARYIAQVSETAAVLS